jgi:hypothetical protein
MAHAGALAKLAPGDKEALQLLLALPKTPLAVELNKTSPVNYCFLRRAVGQHLQTVAGKKSETRKAVVPFFNELLQSMTIQQVEDRVFGANVLATWGDDARDALPVLKKLKLDTSERVRDAVNAAITEIEKGSK